MADMVNLDTMCYTDGKWFLCFGEWSLLNLLHF